MISNCLKDLSGHHSGPIWCMKFSLCGRLLATAGKIKNSVQCKTLSYTCGMWIRGEALLIEDVKTKG